MRCAGISKNTRQDSQVGRRLVVFLGSTIGNLTPGPRPTPRRVGGSLQPGDSLLLGTDLVKDLDRLVRAYDDSAGVTAPFNRNVLSVVNRKLGADFDLDAFEHVARWNAEEERIEMRLRADECAAGPDRGLDLTVDFAAGEEMLTEVSSKFRPEGVADELAEAGLRRTAWWTDSAGDFGLSLGNAVMSTPNSLAEQWRAARPAVAGLHLDSAACSRQMFAVIDAAGTACPPRSGGRRIRRRLRPPARCSTRAVRPSPR